MILRRFQNGGFTLPELLVSFAIIAILASVFMANVNGARSKARDAVRIKNLEQVYTALYMYYLDHKRYPITHWEPTVGHEDIPGEYPGEQGHGLQYYLNGPGGNYLAGNPLDWYEVSGYGGLSWYYHIYPKDARGFVMCVQLEKTNYSVLNSDLDEEDKVAGEVFGVNSHNFGIKGPTDDVYCRGRWF